MKRICALAVSLVALALGASPALAEDGGSSALPTGTTTQTASQSLATVQASSATVSPGTSATAPVNSSTPVSVASDTSGSSTEQTSSASSSASSSTSSTSTQQSVDQSAGSIQAGSTSVDPAVSASAPVNANAPVCVASDCSGGSIDQSSGGGSASTSSNGSGGSQSADQSAASVQAGQASVDPAVSASAPVNANAPVCVASDCSGQSTEQGSNGGANASSGSNGGGSSPQTATHSIGTAQIGDTTVNPAAATSLPVNGNAPICVLSDCASGSLQQGSNGGSSASTGSHGGGSANQTTTHSIGTAQIGDATVNPAAAVSLPVNGNAPICVLSDCASSSTNQSSTGGSSAATGSNGGGSANQTTTHSIGTAQLGDATVNPAATISLPVNGNAPVCVLSDCSSGSLQQGSNGGSSASTGSHGGGSANQTTTHSIGTAQIGSSTVNPAAAVSLPVNGNAPICVLSDCAS